MPLQPQILRRRNGLCLLSLDAGGSRCISQLKILAEMMHRLNFGVNEKSMDRPCSVFDMIGGVGSGGFIAILLVIFGLTVDEALNEFIDLSVNVLDKLGLDSQARTHALRDHVDDLMRKYGMSQKVHLLDSNDNSRGCKLVVPISYKHHVGATCVLRNFTVYQEKSVDLTIAEALLATVATPPAFESLSISKDAATFEYMGADWTLSNPTHDIMAEARGAFGTEAMVACLLSLGCGNPGVFSLPENSELSEWTRILERVTMDSERKAQSLESQLRLLGLYYRFSVTSGLEGNNAANNLDPGVILSHTRVYVDGARVSQRMDVCIESLRIREGVSSLQNLTHIGGATTSVPHLPPLTKTFIMRREPWEFIKKKLLGPKEDNDTATLRMLIVTGIGGCGKTQLMIKFMNVHEAEFSSRFFIDGSSEDRIRADIIRNVRALSADHSQKGFDECLLFLSNQRNNKPRLLLYDNVDDPELDLSPLLPQGSSCTIAITSRNHIIGKLYPESHIRLDIMSMEEAVDLLSYGSISFTKEDRKDREDLADSLGCLPIALQQARSYMQHTGCSIKAYIERLSTNRVKLLGREIKQQLDMKAISTYAAFETSFSRVSSYAQKLLRLLAHFHWSGFPLDLITLAARYHFCEYKEKPIEHDADFYSGKHVLEEIFHRDGEWDVTNLDDMLLSLQNYSLVTVVSGVDTSLSQIHPLVHEWLVSSAPKSEQDAYQSAAVVLLALGAYADGTATMKYLSSHVIHMSPLWDHLHVNNLVAFAHILFKSGVFQDALQLQETVVKELRKALDMDDLNLISSLWALARIYRGFGRLNEARELQEEVLKARKKVLGDKNLETFRASLNLAATYRNLGLLNDAEAIQVEVLKMIKEILGDRDPATLHASTSLAATYHAMGRLNEAAVIQVEALEIRKDVLGERHPDTLHSSTSLAATYRGLGHLKDAAKIEAEALEIRKEVLGERHPDTLHSSTSLATTYRGLGRLKEAVIIQAEALKISKEVLGDRHPNTLKASTCLATIYRDLGQLNEAEVLQDQLLKTCKETLGNQHPTTIDASHHLAITYCEQGRFQDALAVQTKVLIYRKKLQGDNHPDAMHASSEVARVLHRMGRLHEAEPLAAEVLQRRTDIIGARHVDTLISSNNLAAIYCDLGRLEEAELLQSKALVSMKEILGERHYITTRAVLVLAKVYQSRRRKEEALKLLTTAEAIISEDLGVTHPQYLEYLSIQADVQGIVDSLHMRREEDSASPSADLASTSQSRIKRKWYKKLTSRKVFTKISQ